MKRAWHLFGLAMLVGNFLCVVLGFLTWLLVPEKFDGTRFARLLIHGTVVALILRAMSLPKMEANESKK